MNNEPVEELRAVFRSSFTETDWSPVDGPLPEQLEGGDGLNELESRLKRLEQALSSKERELLDKDNEIVRLMAELEKILTRGQGAEETEGAGQEEEKDGARSELEERKEEIERDREEVRAIRKEYEEKLTMLGEREFSLNRMEEELDQKKEALTDQEAEPSRTDPRLAPDSLLEKGRSMAATNQNLQAYFFFRLAVYMDPKNTVALNNLSISLYRLGFKEKAGMCIRKLLDMDPENQAAKTNLGRMKRAAQQGT